ncbi:MAG: hypothetical protein ACYS7Y_27485 [Planctomycetota bacterium]|jgi:hypothetical protein
MADSIRQKVDGVHILVVLCLVLLSTAACSKKENPGQEPRYVLRERICPGVFKITSVQRNTTVLNAGRRTVSSGPVETNFEATLTVSQADAEDLYHATFQMDRVRMTVRRMTVDTNEPEPRSTEERTLPPTAQPIHIRKEKKAKHQLHTLAASFTEAPVSLVFDANMTLIERSSRLHEKVTDGSPEVKAVFEQVGFNLDDLFTEAVIKSCREMLPEDKAGIGALWRYTAMRDILGQPVEWRYAAQFEQVVEQDGSKIAHITYRGLARDRHRRKIKLRGESVTIDKITSNANGTLLFDIALGFPKQLTFDSNAKVWMTQGSRRVRCDTAQEMTVTFTRLK